MSPVLVEAWFIMEGNMGMAQAGEVEGWVLMLKVRQLLRSQIDVVRQALPLSIVQVRRRRVVSVTWHDGDSYAGSGGGTARRMGSTGETKRQAWTMSYLVFTTPYSCDGS